MKKLLLPLICALTLFASDAILKLDTLGHQGTIWDIVVTHDGKIVSASDDKTIRVWDSKTGREERKILGHIGVGNEGKIFAIALSPDEKILAVGGYLNTAGNYEYGNIRLYEFSSGKLIQVLKSHENIIEDLSFDERGNLYSASYDKSVKVWDNNHGIYALRSTFREHTAEAFAIKPLIHSSSFVSAGYDNVVNLYDGTKVIATYRHTEKLSHLAVSSRYIAACGYGKEILIFDTHLNLIRTIQSSTNPNGLAFSPDETKLVSGVGEWPFDKVTVYDTANNFREISTFTKHNNSVKAVVFIDNDTIVSGGGDDKDIYVWNAVSAKEKIRITGKGKSIWRVGINGNRLGFGNYFDTPGDYHTVPSSIQKVFNLEEMRVSTSDYNPFSAIDTAGLFHKAGGDYGYPDAVLVLPNGTQVTRDAINGYRHFTYGKAGEYIISGGGNGLLTAYDKNANTIATFIGHTGSMWSLAVDGETMVSGGDDQVVNMWDLSPLRAGTMQSISPKLSLFVGTDNEWVIWTPSGYYASSHQGDRYVGWHVNQGADHEALFYPVGKFKGRYYNPELISLIIGGLSEKEALAKLGEKVQTLSIAESLPPFITPAQFPELSTSTGELNVKVRVVSRSADILGYKFLFNGRPLENTRALKPAVSADGSINLFINVPKENGKLSVIAQNKFGFSDPADFQITYEGSSVENVFKPRLYVLSIGVGAYDDKELSLDFPAKDANDFATVWKKQHGKFYKEVVTKVLTDKQASKDNILDALEWIQKETTARDVAVIFIAGHGINDDAGQFYYLPVGIDVQKVKRTGVPFSEFKNTLSSIAGKVMLFADACHSGNITGKRRAVDNNSFIAELNDAENGVVVFSSSTGKQYSLEDKAWQNGAFTKAVVEGLNGKADLLGKGKMTVDSLSVYVSERVKELTKGRQTPTMGKPDTISDFPIGVK